MQSKLEDYYETIVQHQVSIGEQPIRLGNPGRCRYCGNLDEAKFRQVAHAFPEALGNRWLISVDECDDCNERFSICDAALIEAVGAFLTLGGVPRKHSSARQFGKSSGERIVRHSREEGQRHTSIRLKTRDTGFGMGLSPNREIVRMRIPMPGVPFIPARAYRAVAKMGFSLIPDSELIHFDAERDWLLGIADAGRVRDRHVVASFGVIGCAPPLVAAHLLRRRDPSVPLPYMLFVACVGSICMQIAIKADALDAHVPSDAVCQVYAQSIVNIGTPEAHTVRIVYARPVVWDWSALESVPQPVEAMILTFNQRTSEGWWEPVFR